MKKTAKKKAVKQPSTSHHEFDISSDHLSETEKRPTERLVKDLFLDPKNPRLADTPNTGTQASIMKAMARDFDLQPLIDSLYKNGFFWEEPLVAVTEPLTELNKQRVLIVIEGNRRLAALKTILDNPKLFSDDKARARLSKVPVIVRDKRSETLAFVGFRHITGIVAWESAAKAQYAHGLVKEGMTLDAIAQTIGDKTRDIGRWVRTQSLIEHAHEQGLNESDAAKSFYFSYLLTATDAPATKKWLELKVDDPSGLVSSVNAEKLEELWMWLYGSKSKEISAVVPESRQIHKLNKVIASSKAVEELERTGNLERALIETKESGDYALETLGSIRSMLQDLSANLSGHPSLKDIVKDNAKIKKIRSEFERVQNTLSEVKVKIMN